LAVDTIQQAARFAKLADYPLKIIWTREQDIQHDRFRPAYLDRVTATLTPDTLLPKTFHHHTTGATVLQYFTRKPYPEGQLDQDLVAGSVNMPYAIPSGKWEWTRQDSAVAVNWWRGVGEGHNVFVVESFIDELALAAGADPVEYRRALLKDNPRALAVLRKAAEASSWHTKLPSGQGRGISLHQCFGSFAALVCEVSVSDYGDVSIKRLTAAVDCGISINPDSIVAQMQGGVLFGLSAALYNGITFKDGRVRQSNFHDYRQLRLNEVPPFDVYLISNDEAPGGMGEVGTVSAPAALTNAIYAATGVRLRSLPIERSLLARKGNRKQVPEVVASSASVWRESR
jgi:isoquinoline 1-oxidoreductase beta subunit